MADSEAPRAMSHGSLPVNLAKRIVSHRPALVASCATLLEIPLVLHYLLMSSFASLSASSGVFWPISASWMAWPIRWPTSSQPANGGK